MIGRTDGWADRLRDTVAAWETRPFRWGETDCACFMAACVVAMTGRDPLETWRGLYNSRLTAAGRLHGRGCRSVADMLARELVALGAEPIDPRAAAVGDIGVTVDDVACVRLPVGWTARLMTGAYGRTNAVQAWAV